MRVLHFTNRLEVERGGVVRAVLDMASALAHAVECVTIMTCYDGGASASISDSGTAKVPRIEELPVDPIARIRALVDDHDIVHLHGLWVPLTATIAEVAHRCGKPYVVTLHGMLGEWSVSQKRFKKTVYLALRGRKYLSRAATLCYTCEDELQQARRFRLRAHAEVVPLIVPVGPGSNVPRSSGQRFRIGYLGRLHPVKGIDVLIDATQRLLDDGQDVELRIAGTGEASHESEIRRRAAPLVEAGRATFAGFVSGDEKQAFLRSVDVLGLVSKHENFGLSWAEALNNGTPVIVSRGVGPWREIEDQGGYIVERDAQAVATALQTVIDAPSEARDRADRGQRWVRTAFAPETIAARLHAIYERATTREGLDPVPASSAG